MNVRTWLAVSAYVVIATGLYSTARTGGAGRWPLTRGLTPFHKYIYCYFSLHSLLMCPVSCFQVDFLIRTQHEQTLDITRRYPLTDPGARGRQFLHRGIRKPGSNIVNAGATRGRGRGSDGAAVRHFSRARFVCGCGCVHDVIVWVERGGGVEQQSSRARW